MTNITRERVRYAETDAMGVTHHTTYLLWMELGRTNLLREAGLSYRELESRGVMLPVVSLGVKYIAPSYYDDLIEIHSTATRFTNVRLRIDYKIYGSEGKLISIGYTEHAIIDSHTRKIIKAPLFLREKINLPKNADDFINKI